MLTGGDYDFLAHVQAPDDKAVTEYVLAAGMSGYTKPVILQSFTEAELNEIFSKLDKSTPVTLQVRRGDNQFYATLRPLPPDSE